MGVFVASSAYDGTATQSRKVSKSEDNKRILVGCPSRRDRFANQCLLNMGVGNAQIYESSNANNNDKAKKSAKKFHSFSVLFYMILEFHL